MKDCEKKRINNPISIQIIQTGTKIAQKTCNVVDLKIDQKKSAFPRSKAQVPLKLPARLAAPFISASFYLQFY